MPLRLYMEKRRSVSYSITNAAVVLRVPRGIRKARLQELIDTARQQTIKYFQSHPEIRSLFIRKKYQPEDSLQVGQTTYQISIDLEDRKTDRIQIFGNQLLIILNEHLPEETRQNRIRKLLSRAVAADQLPAIQQRVLDLNEKYFGKSIQDVRLKYNHSNWGSCSSNDRINLSTRLLFAPDEVIDYVIIHELAHLIEMNHSPAFWKIVADIMPDYKRHIKWLKVHGGECDF